MTNEIKNSKANKSGLNIEEMAKAGLHLGHQTSKVNPKMKLNIIGTRGGVAIIDLDKTMEKLALALEFIGKAIAEGKTLLLVGTKPQMKDVSKKIALECGLPYINERWLGGTFTNFSTLKKSIDHFKDLEKKKAAGELEKYTKKEKAKIDKELKDLEIKYGGIKDMDKFPDIVFVCDTTKDELAIKEAKKKKIIVVAINDVDSDPTQIDYPIPANDDAITSVKYILEKVRDTVLENKPKKPKI